jgi:hypothetical protein
MQDTKIELDIQSLNINGDAKAIREKGYLYQPRPNLYGRAIITSTECGSLSKRKKSTTRVVPQKQYPIHKLPKLFYAQAPGDLNYERLPLLDLNHYLPLIGDCLVVKAGVVYTYI